MGCLFRRVLGQQIRDGGIGGRERVLVNLAHAAAVKILTAEVAARLQRHMTFGTVCLRFRRIVKATCANAGYTTQQVRIVVILPAQEFLVVVQLDGDAEPLQGIPARAGSLQYVPAEWNSL